MTGLTKWDPRHRSMRKQPTVPVASSALLTACSCSQICPAHHLTHHLTHRLFLSPVLYYSPLCTQRHAHCQTHHFPHSAMLTVKLTTFHTTPCSLSNSPLSTQRHAHCQTHHFVHNARLTVKLTTFHTTPCSLSNSPLPTSRVGGPKGLVV